MKYCRVYEPFADAIGRSTRLAAIIGVDDVKLRGGRDSASGNGVYFGSGAVEQRQRSERFPQESPRHD